MQMTFANLRELFEDFGYDRALAALEAEGLPSEEEYRLQEALEAWEAERLRRWTRPSRYPAAFNPHEF
jgi:hypothetical protein